MRKLPGAVVAEEEFRSEPRTPHVIRGVRRREDGVYEPVERERGRKIFPMLFVVRAPCRPCNMGWMARLEHRAKPVLVGLMQNQIEVLTEDQAATLRRWAWKTAMMFGHNDPGSQVYDQAAHQALMQGEEPAGALGVWMFRCADDIQRFRITHSQGLVGASNRTTGEYLGEIAQASQVIMAADRVGFLVRYVTTRRMRHDLGYGLSLDGGPLVPVIAGAPWPLDLVTVDGWRWQHFIDSHGSVGRMIPKEPGGQQP